MLVQLLIVVLVVVIIFLLVTRIRPNPILDHYTENYGGRQRICEDRCFSSPYYDECLNVCMDPAGESSWTGHGLMEISEPSVEASIPLEDEEEERYVIHRGSPEYRYDYPGH